MASTGDIETQRDSTLGRSRGQSLGQSLTIKGDEHEAVGYGDTSTKIWKLYDAESERHDRGLVDSWKSNTDSMLIFTGLFSSIVASFLIETYKTLVPNPNSPSTTPFSAPSSAVRVNIFMFLSLFFSVISALMSTLIQQWAREYLQYSQPSTAPHKRGRVRAYLFHGLSKFQMRRLTYGVPVLLHVSVFLFFYALSEWLLSINVPVGTTARYCLVALFSVYMALSVLPLIVRNAPYQTALTTPLQACVSLVRVSCMALVRLVRRSSTIIEGQKWHGLFKGVHVDRARALMTEIKKRESQLDRSAMRWLLQELDEDHMDTFLSGLPGYFRSPLTDKVLAVEGLIEDGVQGRIKEHITTCVTSVELSQAESMLRASACINSLRLISEMASNPAVRRSGMESDDIEVIMDYLEPLCFDPSTAIRASCIRGLVLREFLIPYADLDAEKLQTKTFPGYLIPLYEILRVWKETEISQWSRLTGVLTAPGPQLPSDPEMWVNVVYDGPLINLAVLAYAVLSHANEGDVNLDMPWKTLETLLKSLGLAQVHASTRARAQFEEVVRWAHGDVSGYEGGVTQSSPLLKTLDIAISGLRLAEAFAYTPKPMLPRKQIEVIFGPEQLRNTKLLEAFAAHLPGYVTASTREVSQNFMERLILEDKLWEQLHVNLLECFNPIPFPDKLRILMAFFDIFDVAFDVLEESTSIEWRSLDLHLLFRQLWEFETTVAPGKFIKKVFYLRIALLRAQLCHVLLSQFSIQRRRGEPLMMEFLDSFVGLVMLLGVGTQEDLDNLTLGRGDTRTGFDVLIRAEPILSVALRDGPLSNFCMIGKQVFKVVVSDVSDLTSDDTKKLWKTLERMLDDPSAPFANSSKMAWARFDDLCDSVRNPPFLEGNNQIVERLGRLLDMVEKVERMRPPADMRAEETGNVYNRTRADGSVDSSSQVEASHLELASRGGIPPHQYNFDPTVVYGSPTSFVPTTRSGAGAETRPTSAYPPYAPRVPPSSFPAPFPSRMAGSRLPPMATSHPYTFPPLSFSPPDSGTPPGYVIQGDPIPVDWTSGYSTPDAEGREDPSRR